MITEEFSIEDFKKELVNLDPNDPLFDQKYVRIVFDKMDILRSASVKYLLLPNTVEEIRKEMGGK